MSDEAQGHIEFGWLIDDMLTFTWREGDEPHVALAKYRPVLVRREVGPWQPTSDPRFTPVDKVRPACICTVTDGVVNVEPGCPIHAPGCSVDRCAYTPSRHCCAWDQGDDDYCGECGSPAGPALTMKRGGSPGEMERCRSEWHAPRITSSHPEAP